MQTRPRGSRSFVRWGAPPGLAGPGPLPRGWADGDGMNRQAGVCAVARWKIENRRSGTISVNRFVNRTLRDGLKWGRRWRSGTNTSRLSTEVSTVPGDGRDEGDGRRVAHNPEVAGSNPAPATKVRGRFRTRNRPLACSLCTDADRLAVVGTLCESGRCLTPWFWFLGDRLRTRFR
jgi:hypothetical protein